MSDFYNGLAEILEVDASDVNGSFNLVEHNWDSLAIISTIALVDECYGVMVNGTALSKCKLVADIETLIKQKTSGQ